ncbi:30S ribosomal protein S12 methylthiotransferase RimO [Paramaledivibacter caminithermalis]|uniref:Ribosomal protein uS12 methylthiotransferase RimO n=1 Tax=Paramaledivibacter caminithermalis (strain DSM 15212 / CIP 107654 / DViRD3) TaxID=1121301 RepID=A0A1M6N4F9_PARC5|nr:30S ribosomal protein S12 methylthiotransferase RimO [Paramaledivibacter caminithermalis]SHJ90619.1 ribosomal protein S12 methylthiotransferase [Paramaledivibacter caminithermalis DSM 15212]
MNEKIYLETLGCSKNQVDSEIMLGILKEHNYDFTYDESEADIIIINTCGFIESAKKESIDTILELAQLKKTCKCKILIVTGCLAQRYSKELSMEIPEVDAFLGTTNFNEIAKIINKILKNNERIVSTANSDKAVEYDLPRILTSPSYTAYLKIAEGCDNYCTYCIIPKLRGKYKSRPIEKIVNEAKNLAKNGTKELIVIAQDITRYGIDLYGNYQLCELLKQLNSIEELKWIRLQYSYPDIISDELIEVIESNKKICKYIDIPIQHCNNKILKEMNRRTTKEHIITVINKLRKKIPDIAIRTTLITGFPGETDEQFTELYDFVKEIEFDKLGVFTYSREEDTPAAKLPKQIPEDIKENRRDKIMLLQRDISLKKNMDKIGRVYDILIEEKIENENVYVGRTEFDAPEIDGVVYINSHLNINIGEFIRAKIIDALEYDLIGEVVNELSE